MVARPPLLVPLLATAGFVVLTILVVAGWAPLDRADNAVSEALREYGDSRASLISVIRIATDVSATIPFLVTGLAFTLGLVARGRRDSAGFCAVVTAVVPALWALAHWLLHHPRPVDGFVTVQSNGFPSGHTSNATATALVGVLLLWPRMARTGRILVVVLATAFALGIGVTRLALLAHWPADVLGGWLLALAVVSLAARLTRRPTSAAGSGHAAEPGPAAGAGVGSAERGEPDRGTWRWDLAVGPGRDGAHR